MRKKRLLLVLMAAVLLAVFIPGTAMAAASPNAAPIAQIKSLRTINADLSIWPAGPHQFSMDSQGNLYATVHYAGTVNKVLRDNKDWAQLAGCSVDIIEYGSYYKNYVALGDTYLIHGGTTSGTLTITGPDHATAIFSFQSVMWLDTNGDNPLESLPNPATWKFKDIGAWKVEKTSNSLNILKNAAGIWTASVGLLDFAGSAHMSGVY